MGSWSKICQDHYTLDINAMAILVGKQVSLQWKTFQHFYNVLQGNLDNRFYAKEYVPILVELLGLGEVSWTLAASTPTMFSSMHLASKES